MQSRIFPAFLSVLAFATTGFIASATPAHAHKCGTAFAIKNRQAAQSQKDASGSAMRATPAPKFARPANSCEATEYYDTVLTRETEHFQIFYTLDEGPHATTPEFIDTLAVTLEKALTFHTKTMGMRAPQAIDTTSHYRMPVKKGLYPVEVAELDFLRDPLAVLEAEACNGCFGATYANKRKDYRKSEIVIDNDFMYVPEYSSKTGSIEKDGKTCNYPLSTEAQINKAYGYRYNDEWANGIRVTVFHEMFHAVQLQYTNLYNYWTYWIEASATANEEIGAPDINDYFLYVPKFINSVGIPLDRIASEYSISLLYLYLYNHVDKHFDKEIWELIGKDPAIPFKDQLKKVLDKRGIKIDSLYQSFATALALSGENAASIDSSFWVHSDQPGWPTVSPILQAEKFVPDTTGYAFNFYTGADPILDDYRGKASAIIFKNGKAVARNINNTGSIDTVSTESFFADSVFWVFSRFDDPKHIPEIIKDSTLRAYPVPWRGSGQLCFTPLPESKKFIEIRSGRGELILREPYTKTTHCIEGEHIRAKMKPGVYRFRAGSSGKTEKFIVVY